MQSYSNIFIIYEFISTLPHWKDKLIQKKKKIYVKTFWYISISGEKLFYCLICMTWYISSQSMPCYILFYYTCKTTIKLLLWIVSCISLIMHHWNIYKYILINCHLLSSLFLLSNFFLSIIKKNPWPKIILVFFPTSKRLCIQTCLNNHLKLDKPICFLCGTRFPPFLDIYLHEKKIKLISCIIKVILLIKESCNIIG